MKLYIGCTTRRDIDAACVDSILRYMLNPVRGTRMDISRGDGFVGRLRNKYTADFLSDKSFTDLLNLDSDIAFNRSHVERIMSHDADIVGGVYYKKEPGRLAVLEDFPGPSRNGEPPTNGLVQVRFMGTGFLRVRRRVFEAMIEEYGDEMWYIEEGSGKKMWNFWPIAVEKTERRLLSEDWWFCHRANELGFRVYADTKCTLGHVGVWMFPWTVWETHRQLIEDVDRAREGYKCDPNYDVVGDLEEAIKYAKNPQP